MIDDRKPGEMIIEMFLGGNLYKGMCGDRVGEVRSVKGGDG